MLNLRNRKLKLEKKRRKAEMLTCLLSLQITSKSFKSGLSKLNRSSKISVNNSYKMREKLKSFKVTRRKSTPT